MQYTSESIQGCNHCKSQWFEVFKGAFNDTPNEGCKYVDNDDILCSICNVRLNEDDFVITNMEEFEKSIIDRIADEISDQIGECEYCDGGMIAYQQKYTEPSTFEEIIEFEIPDGLFEAVEELVECGNCGRSVSGGVNVASHWERDRYYGYDYLAERDFLINSLGIMESEAKDFLDYLKQHPMMALNHEVGIKLFGLIKSRKITGIEKLKKENHFYRARKRNIFERRVEFIEEEMWAPPFEKANNGRFNPVGSSALYLANLPTTTVAEIDHKWNIHEVVEVAEFRLNEEIIVLDIRKLDCKTLLTMPSLNVGTIQSEYLLPNFIAQCCSVTGISGILYESVKDSTGYNLVLLNYKKGQQIVYESKIVCRNVLDLQPYDPTLVF